MKQLSSVYFSSLDKFMFIVLFMIKWSRRPLLAHFINGSAVAQNSSLVWGQQQIFSAVKWCVSSNRGVQLY